ncbi:permease prefix domain 1-containing protein [Streptomyces sp. SP18CS02]|uniref:permease prefix domain 1-containing protein n=1 Tax=Streptomyces sp. SP18CS02 TaxID=3002531 RepID=UPI002E774CC8|nr:permease prefix domain 1-containing protein [Streptomyces sp. SP18CS02]MEE1751572.1 permease prefix domain 1-containing protein [Streptomyces sp. SP18CS02]
MNGPDPRAERVEDRVEDPVEAHVAALSSALHGPARAKARMVEEMRGGLKDAVAAYTGEGAPYARAARQAVREFGSVDELASGWQRELTIAQARHTARAIALTAPFLLVCGQLILNGGPGHGRRLPHVAHVLVLHLTGVAVVATLLAGGALALTGALARRLPEPRRLPLAVAWTGTTAAAAMGLVTLTLALASPWVRDWPLLALAAALTAASHGVVAASARACRRCARLPFA